MTLPSVSVIIPSYNRFDFLSNAIESVKNQEYKKRKAGVNMFLNGALGARKKKKVKGKSSSLRRIVDNFESQF